MAFKYIETGIPGYLQVPKQGSVALYTEWTWEEILRRVATGQSLFSISRDPTMPRDYASVMRWILADESRRALYYEAKAVAAEIIEEEMLDIADDVGEAVDRSNVRLNTRKWLLAVRNKRRFETSTKVETAINIDIGAAMKDADIRVVNK